MAVERDNERKEATECTKEEEAEILGRDDEKHKNEEGILDRSEENHNVGADTMIRSEEIHAATD
jgi:hypothetical protein